MPGSFSLLGFYSLYIKHSWLCDEVHSQINSLLPFGNILIGFFFVCQLAGSWVEPSLNESAPKRGVICANQLCRSPACLWSLGNRSLACSDGFKCIFKSLCFY